MSMIRRELFRLVDLFVSRHLKGPLIALIIQSLEYSEWGLNWMSVTRVKSTYISGIFVEVGGPQKKSHENIPPQKLDGRSCKE